MAELAPTDPRLPAITEPNAHDRFVLRQRFRFAVNQYEFSLPAEGDAPAEPFCFVQQKRFKFKEDIRFYTDDTKSVELLRIKARQRFDPRASYDVTSGSGERIGAIQKVFGKSLLRSTYRVLGPRGEELAIATESSLPVALVRRFVGLIPYIEIVADFLPIPYHFVFLRRETELGSHKRQMWKLRDVYTIDMSGDPDKTVDRRLVLALAVGMDALQAR